MYSLKFLIFYFCRRFYHDFRNKDFIEGLTGNEILESSFSKWLIKGFGKVKISTNSFDDRERKSNLILFEIYAIDILNMK